MSKKTIWSSFGKSAGLFASKSAFSSTFGVTRNRKKRGMLSAMNRKRSDLESRMFDTMDIGTQHFGLAGEDEPSNHLVEEL